MAKFAPTKTCISGLYMCWKATYIYLGSVYILQINDVEDFDNIFV